VPIISPTSFLLLHEMPALFIEPCEMSFRLLVCDISRFSCSQFANQTIEKMDIPESDLLRDILLALQGVESGTIQFNPESDSFVVSSKVFECFVGSLSEAAILVDSNAAVLPEHDWTDL
jgi:hypothetical protein